MNPRISRHYAIIGHTPDAVELRHGIWNPVSLTLTDEAKAGHLFSVLTSLDGSLSVAEIARKLGLRRDDVEGVLDQLRDLGALEEHGPRTALDYYLDTITPGLKSLSQPSPTRFSSVLIMGDTDIAEEISGYLKESLPGDVSVSTAPDDELQRIIFDADTSWLADGLAFSEKVHRFEAWRTCLTVLAMKDLNPIACRTLNRVSIAIGMPWFHAALDGPFVLIGPLFIPNRSSCYECFEMRVAMNLREHLSYQLYKNALVAGRVHGRVPCVHPALIGLVAAHVAMELLNFVFTGSTFTAQKLLGIYLPTMEFAFNDVLRLPGCPGCGSHPERDDKELFFGLEMLAQAQEDVLDGKGPR